jgi:hypothetical protein
MSLAESVVLRHGAVVEDPAVAVLGFLEAHRRTEVGDRPGPASFDEADLRLANRGGARISAAQVTAILERRQAIERALRAIAADASLTSAPGQVARLPLRQLFDAFADVRGVGLAKMTKALHPKRPALIPILDSVVQKYLSDNDIGPSAPFGERALVLVRAYKRDLDINRSALRAVQRDLASHGYELTEVRILDLLIMSAQAGA